jgi:hypothetical protein
MYHAPRTAPLAFPAMDRKHAANEPFTQPNLGQSIRRRQCQTGGFAGFSVVPAIRVEP